LVSAIEQASEMPMKADTLTFL